MERYRTSAIVYEARWIPSMGQSRSPAATTVPEEHADKDEKNTSASTNSDSSDRSFTHPSKIQFSYRCHKCRDCSHEDEEPPPESVSRLQR